MNEELFGSRDEPTIGFVSEIPSGDGSMFTMEVEHKDLSRNVEVEFTGTAMSMIDVEPVDAVKERVKWELEGLPNDVDWTVAVGAPPLPFNSKHVEGGIGRSS